MSTVNPAPRMTDQAGNAVRTLAAACGLWAAIALAAPGSAPASEARAEPDGESRTAGAPTQQEDHPLAPVLRMAQEGVAAIERDIRDYTCTIIMRERREGRLKPYQVMDAKIRHEDPATDTPFSVYLKFTSPANVEGREVLYLNDRNADKMLVRRGGRRMAYVTTYLDPDSPLALEENRYPVTKIGFKGLVKSLIEVIKEDMQHGECTVQYFKNAKIGDTRCTRIVVEHPRPREHFRFHRAVVYIDEELNLPIAYASYLWPREPGGEAVLVEEYIHANIRLNVGLTDKDFDRSNPDYAFMQPDGAMAQD